MQDLNINNGAKSTDHVIIHGSTWIAIWQMAWPLFLNMVVIAVANFADVWVAGKLGPDVQAAIGIGGQIWFLMVMCAIALSTGTTAIVSRYRGARDIDSAVEVSRQSLLFAFIFGASSAVLGLCLCRPLLHVLGASPTVERLGWDYLKVDLWSQLPMTVIWISNSIFRAIGNTRVPLIIWLVVAGLVICLDLFFCFVLHFGITGIGTAWVIATCVGATLVITLLNNSELKECLSLSLLKTKGLSKKWFLRLFKIGMPACIQDLAWVGGNFALLLIFAQTNNPTACQAAWSIGNRLEEMVSVLPIYAIGTALGTIVGQNLGAQKSERAEQAGWQACFIASVFSIIVGLIMFLCAKPIAFLMSSDNDVIKYTMQYLQIVGLCQPYIALWLTLTGAMQGAGYTKWPMFISLISYVAFRLPLCWILTIYFKLGPIGVWLGLAISEVVMGCLAVWRFQKGVWKLQRV